jgi:hypothetical protein
MNTSIAVICYVIWCFPSYPLYPVSAPDGAASNSRLTAAESAAAPVRTACTKRQVTVQTTQATGIRSAVVEKQIGEVLTVQM